MREYFKDYRNRTGFTLDEMAKQMNCSRAYLYLIESGQREGSLLFWEKFQKAFEVPDTEMYKFIKRS